MNTSRVHDLFAETSVTTHFILTKIEKTGSSTLASIFARFALKHRSNVMTMTYGGHLDVTKAKGQVPGIYFRVHYAKCKNYFIVQQLLSK